jgi:metallo-beta-lactamase family protein
MVTFWGAARTVTGSMHLLAAGHLKVLLDCGLVRGTHPHERVAASRFPFDPAALDAVILSHAHIDHCGHLAALVRQGFAGPIFCTPATRDLLGLMLRNSARIQADEAFAYNVIRRASVPRVEPLFTHDDIDQALAQCVVAPYGEEWAVSPELVGQFANAGHILGSAMVALELRTGKRPLRLTFTGDLGRRGSPLLTAADPVPPADLVVAESTYGDRTLDSVEDTVVALEKVVRDTAERAGKVLIPAFSLGRTQVVVQVLAEAITAGRLPSLPVYVDSPMAADIALVHAEHPELLTPAGRRHFAETAGVVHYLREAEESRAVSLERGPAVLIAPGGMCDGGRIVHHLRNHLDDPRCTVVLVNYQAPHTLGRRLLERGPTVRFHGRVWNKWADVVYLPGFSAHADRADLLAFLDPLSTSRPKVRLVHGEPEQAQALAAALAERGFPDVAIPVRGESEPLN